MRRSVHCQGLRYQRALRLLPGRQEAQAQPVPEGGGVMARFNRGWFKIDRELADGDIAKRGNFTLGLFVRILHMANWKDGNSLLGGQRVKVQAGQLATGLRELSPDLVEDPHMNKVRSALRYLETRGTIAQAINNHGRIITVCNWAEYQRVEDEPHKQTTDDAQTGHRPPTNGPQHSEEGKKVRNKNTVLAGARIDYPEAFEGIWKQYQVGKKPRGEKKTSLEVFQSLDLSEAELLNLKKAIAGYLAANPEEKYRLHFQRFLKSDWRVHAGSAPAPSRTKTIEDVMNGL